MTFTDENTFDIIIVGGGTAGLVLASRLSEDPQLHVAVLEAGEDQTADPRVLTPAMAPALWNTPSDWSLLTVPQAGLGGREIYIPQGKMLGGSSGLNGMTFTASSKAVVDGWAQLGNPATHASMPLSRSEGPLKVAFADTSGDEWPKIWSKTLETLGFPGAQNTLSSQGIGGLVIPDSIDPTTAQRSFSANAYLAPARSRADLTVITGVEVHKVLLEKGTNLTGDSGAVATGVQYSDREGRVNTAHARREVILSAGALGSAGLLEQSGIGEAGRLTRLGIDVVVDNPGVCENLQNQPMATFTVQVSKAAPPTMDALVRQEPEALGAAMQAYAQKAGPFASSGVVSAAQLPLPGIDTPRGRVEMDSLLRMAEARDSVSPFHAKHEQFVRSVLSSPAEASGYYIFGPAYAGFSPEGARTQPPEGDKDNYITIAVFLAHPLSRGSVHLADGMNQEHIKSRAGGHWQSLAIDPGYLTNPLDIEVMARHVQFIEDHLIATEPLASYPVPGGKRTVGAPGPGKLASLEAAKEFLRDKAVGAHHFTGPCSMMPREMGGVVDSQLRVYGTRNLRVCDASVIPLTPRANPQATVYGVAEHGAGLIKASLTSELRSSA